MMRGRRGRSSLSATQEHARMALGKDGSGVTSGSQMIDEEAPDDEAVSDSDNEEAPSPLPSARERRRRERGNKSRSKELTEEEMVNLALHLSAQEANVGVFKLQQEDEAMKKAIQESMDSQTQPCSPCQSQSLLPAGVSSLRLCSRRKLSFSDRKWTSAIDEGASEDVCPPESDLHRANTAGNENNNGNKNRKRKRGSPLPEMSDLSQTQKLCSQVSPCSSKSLSAPLGSPQSPDSTQIDECQLMKSPVFPSTGCRVEVRIPRLSQDLLHTCRTSGFVLCSQDSCTMTPKSLSAHPKSPTFPKSPRELGACPKSPVFSETDQGDDSEAELSPEYVKSPVFGTNTQHERSPSACTASVGVCGNSGFIFSSQGTLISSMRSMSCWPKSPVFPRSPRNLSPLETSAIGKNPVISETDRGQTEQRHGCSTSPVFRTQRRQKIHPDVNKSPVVPSAPELGGSNSEGCSPHVGDPPQSPRQDTQTTHSQDGRSNRIATSSKSGGAQELNEASKDWNETMMTGNMTLRWSDEEEEDDDITPVGSPSPVFPEERPVHQADDQAAPLNHKAAASPGTGGSNGSPGRVSARGFGTPRDRSSSNKHVSLRSPSSSASTSRQQPSNTEREPQPTVHYYWGVPFCPRGLDPDNYTQVILAQMKVYEKCLKQAQRHLLRKAEWGEPILPQPEKSQSPESPAESPERHIPRRPGLRQRSKKQCEAGDSSPAEAEEEEGQDVEREEGEWIGGQADADDFGVCPETQLSDSNSTQDLIMATGSRVELRPESPEVLEVGTIFRGDSPAGDKPPEEEEQMEVDACLFSAPEDGKMEGSIPDCGKVEEQNVRMEEEKVDRGHPDVEEIKDPVHQRLSSPELELAAIPPTPETTVDCPICQGSFPVTEIEVHAAYCDGEVAVVDERRPEGDCFQVSLKPRRKRTRRADEESSNPLNAGKNQEKCYICQKAVPLREYSRHTELCIHQHSSKAEASQRGCLLSALEQIESRGSDAGPSGSNLQPRDVIDLRDDDKEDDGVSAFRVSDSPIRAFTSISEATDCLIDFTKQPRAKKLSRKRR
uniref:mediator of DNA damage checkpoint protein 1 isoform X2 n=1 Tax=Monopterus albus TaxID=43700 RepID=UPI0009B37439|nr:BRCA1-A complex subunit RAP80 isoform X2 [Monopterus albus]